MSAMNVDESGAARPDSDLKRLLDKVDAAERRYDAAVADFKARIAHYERMYVPLTDEDGSRTRRYSSAGSNCVNLAIRCCWSVRENGWGAGVGRG